MLLSGFLMAYHWRLRARKFASVRVPGLWPFASFGGALFMQSNVLQQFQNGVAIDVPDDSTPGVATATSWSTMTDLLVNPSGLYAITSGGYVYVIKPKMN